MTPQEHREAVDASVAHLATFCPVRAPGGALPGQYMTLNASDPEDLALLSALLCVPREEREIYDAPGVVAASR